MKPSPLNSKDFKITLMSFGYKHGLPFQTDMILDVRFIKNPFFVEHLKNKTGQAPDVKRYVLRQSCSQTFLKKIEGLLTFLIHEYKKGQKSHLTVSVGCTGGQHRSVVVVESIKKILKKKKIPVTVVHRDIS